MAVTVTTHIPAIKYTAVKVPTTSNVVIDFSEMYFAVVHTINGGRFYSEAVQGAEAAYALYTDYCDIAEYFGGVCELFYVNDQGYEVLEHQVF